MQVNKVRPIIIGLLFLIWVVVTHSIFEKPLESAITYKLGLGDEIDFTAITKTADGAGSGLNSDKLDGYQATDFMPSDQWDTEAKVEAIWEVEEIYTSDDSYLYWVLRYMIGADIIYS
ncbi:unnamed protein product, partial [marine sediment metagenome]